MLRSDTNLVCWLETILSSISMLANITVLGKPSPKKSVSNLKKFKGRGLKSESKLFEPLFLSFHVWTFSRKGRGGGLPHSKLFDEFFCLSLDFF